MAQATNSVSNHDFCRARGDSHSETITIRDAVGNPIDITGFSFLLTVDPSDEPTSSANNLFQIAGVIVAPATNGQVRFDFTTTQTNQTPDEYFYDVQQTDGGGKVRTILRGKFIIEQDITK